METSDMMKTRGSLIVIAALLMATLGGCATSETTAAADVAPAAAARAPQGTHTFSQQELDQMLAPIALYPDSLLSQMLMASTYPLEVVEAARWSHAHPDYQGDKAVKAVEKYDWDPSVKSLTAFPRVLDTMNQNLAWTENLGNAFLGQQAEVMDTVQKLRRKAYDAGNLKSNTQVRVVVNAGLISIYYADPDVVYVPYYDSTVVFGVWWWPLYPPMYWAPWPGYVVVSGTTWGGAIYVSKGFFFGTCDWRHRRVDVVNVRSYYYKPLLRRPRAESRFFNRTPGAWRHNPQHRRGVPYRSRELHREYGGGRVFERRNMPRYQAPPSRFGTTPGTGRGKAGPGGQPRFQNQPRFQEQQRFKNQQRFEERERFKSTPRQAPGMRQSPQMRQMPQTMERSPMDQMRTPGQGSRGRERRQGFGNSEDGGRGGRRLH